MKRKLLVLCLMLAATTIARPAFASPSWWSWLEEFSGAGPFRGRAAWKGGLGSEMVTFCGQDGYAFRASPVRRDVERYGGSAQAGASEKPLHCLYIDVVRLHADADPARNYPELNVTHFDAGGSVRLNDGLDIGAGAGFMKFSPGQSRLTVTPFRINTRPILFFVREEDHARWMGFLNLYFKEVFVGDSRPVTGETFGAKAEQFHSQAEFVREIGVTIDVTTLLCAHGGSFCKGYKVK